MALVVGFSRLKTQAMARAIMAANIVKKFRIVIYTLTGIAKFSEGKQFWLRTNKIMSINQWQQFSKKYRTVYAMLYLHKLFPL